MSPKTWFTGHVSRRVCSSLIKSTNEWKKGGKFCCYVCQDYAHSILRQNRYFKFPICNMKKHPCLGRHRVNVSKHLRFFKVIFTGVLRHMSQDVPDMLGVLRHMSQDTWYVLRRLKTCTFIVPITRKVLIAYRNAHGQYEQHLLEQEQKGA